MKAIAQSIIDRSQIQAAMFNTKSILKEIRSYEKILSTPILAKDINENKTRLHIQKLINEAANELTQVEPICKLYHELHLQEFTEVKTGLHKIANRQPLTKIN